MSNFKIKEQKCHKDGFQGIVYSEIGFENKTEYSDQMTIKELLSSGLLESEEIVYSLIKNHKKEGTTSYLRSVFDYSNIIPSDFKCLEKDSLLNYFKEYAEKKSWGEDLIGFNSLRKHLEQFLTPSNSGNYYLLSKDWFFDHKVRIPERDIYGYYFTLIWMGCSANQMNVILWFYD